MKMKDENFILTNTRQMRELKCIIQTSNSIQHNRNYDTEVHQLFKEDYKKLCCILS